MSAGTRQLPRSEARWQPHYVALLWGNRGTEPAQVGRVREAIGRHAAHLTDELALPGLLCFTAGRSSLPTHISSEQQSLVIVGSVVGKWERSAADIADWAAGPWDRLASGLFARMWGSYIAIGRRNDSGELAIVRDPGGGLPVHVIDAGGVAVLSDEIPPWLVNAVDRPLPVDKQLLGQALALPLITTHRSLLRNVVSIPAGALLTWQAKLGIPQQIWDPADHCMPSEGSAELLRTSVLDAVAAWRQRYPRILLELSGGLDSAIVLGALATQQLLDGVKCVNFATSYAGGDERSTARAAAARAGVELAEFSAHEQDIDYKVHLEGEQPAQPILYGLDPVLEAASCGLAEAFDAEAIFTGQGGDSIFYQMPTERVAIDLMRARGPGALFSAAVFDAAIRLHASSWRVQWRMVKDWLWGTSPERLPIVASLLGPAVARDMPVEQLHHPWMANARRLPPGKQLHALVLANCQLFNGPTSKGRRFNLVHPLMAQPVVEASLRVPSFELSYGTNDRALARALFDTLLPPSIARRRGKGEVSSYYRRAIVGNLDFLRSHLLDGTLVAHGLLDADILDKTLTNETLLWSEDARMITIFASFEAWARYWRL